MSPVRPEKEIQLRQKMAALGIREEDLIEQFIRGGGRGGQKLQKTNSCVLLKHPPSGFDVRCEKTRSQVLNRFHARVLLCEKVETALLGAKSKKIQEQEKLRRQKQRRSRKQKARMRQDAEKVSAKKQLRRKVETEKD
jgi:protein subunit release factor B